MRSENRLFVAPVPGIAGITGRQPNDIAVRVDTESEHGAIGVGEIRRYLIELQNLTIIETCAAKDVDIPGGQVRCARGQPLGILQSGEFPARKCRGRIMVIECTVNLSGPHVVRQEPRQSGEMMIYTVLAAIQQADVDTNGFEIWLGQHIARVMQHVLVQRHMPFQGMWAQAVCEHDVIDVIVWPLYAVIQTP